MSQENLIIIARLGALLKDKLFLLDSLKFTVQNSMSALENSEITLFTELIDETEQIVEEINNIDDDYKTVLKSLDNTSYKELKEIYSFFNLFNESPDLIVQAEYLEIYNSLTEQHILLKEIFKINEALQNKSNLTIIEIKQNMKNIKAKKQLNLNYKNVVL
ncbi:MAG: hypothetical protein K0S55_200 [Clostridia bacterium]|nr:hypothetical protein [Clostridia bacterium]